MSELPVKKDSDRAENLPKGISSEKYARLKAEAKAPYQGLRKFIYLACGASGLLGMFVFLAKLAAVGDVSSILPNLALQLGVVALMLFLFRLES